MVWNPCVTPIRFTGRSIPLTTTAIGNSRVPATSSTPGSALMAFMSSMVISWLSGWDRPVACTISAHTRFEPTPSICEMTNFLLVKATVTTSTMDALPIITPREVSDARSLLLRNASMATDTVSRRCMFRPFQGAATLPAPFCLWDRHASWSRTPWRPHRDCFDFQTGDPASRVPAPDEDSQYASARYSNILEVEIRPRPAFGFSKLGRQRDRISPSDPWARLSARHRLPPASVPVDRASTHNLQCRRSTPAIWH